MKTVSFLAVTFWLLGTASSISAKGQNHSEQKNQNGIDSKISISISAVDTERIKESLGLVEISQTPYGLVLSPNLQGLPPGLHGFHLHQNASCKPAEKDGKMVAAAAAGGHYDPDQTGIHDMPWGEGHLGDLPALYVDADGKATRSVLAPRLEMDDLQGRALMVHAGGDNYSDSPNALGGGGARIACGVIE